MREADRGEPAAGGMPVFYESALNGARRRDYAAAREMRGIDAEIALLRLRLRTLLEEEGDSVTALVRLTDALGRLLRLKVILDGAQGQGVVEAVAHVLREIGEPLGLGETAAAAPLPGGGGPGGAGKRAAGPRPDPERGDGAPGRQE